MCSMYVNAGYANLKRAGRGGGGREREEGHMEENSEKHRNYDLPHNCYVFHERPRR